MKIIMGIDGGGSKTKTSIVDESGRILGEGLAGGSNYQTIGMKTAIINITDSIQEALIKANVEKSDISFVQYALAGADRPVDFKNLKTELSKLPFQNWDLVGDVIAGLRLGSENGEGIVVVCGSGTNVVGRNNEGELHQCGGFGYLYGDYAGGNIIAMETFRTAIRSWEGREKPSLLVDEVVKFFEHNNMEELYEDFLNRQVSRVPAGLAVGLHNAIERGDELAKKILTDVGTELGIATNVVVNKMKDTITGQIPIVLIGSVFQGGNNKLLIETLDKTIQQANNNYVLRTIEIEPVYGAVLLGMDALNIEAEGMFVNHFKATK